MAVTGVEDVVAVGVVVGDAKELFIEGEGAIVVGGFVTWHVVFLSISS